VASAEVIRPLVATVTASAETDALARTRSARTVTVAIRTDDKQASAGVRRDFEGARGIEVEAHTDRRFWQRPLARCRQGSSAHLAAVYPCVELAVLTQHGCAPGPEPSLSGTTLRPASRVFGRMRSNIAGPYGRVPAHGLDGHRP